MGLSPRARNVDLAGLCRRLSIGLESGIDLRKVLAREAEGRAPASLRRQIVQIRTSVDRGGSLADAFDACGTYFPSLLRELIRVGEQSGHLDAVFRQLADHYENQVRLRREFLSSISWPLTQLGLSLLLIGGVIWISGILGGKDLRGREIDVLGLGLRGTSGLLIYLTVLAFCAAALAVIVIAARRGVFWARPIQRLLLRVPVAGQAFEALAMARLAWSLHLTGESGMSLLKALPLCLQATQNDRYISQTERILTSVRRGESLTDALSATHVFPARFLDVLDVGERSGRLPEAMQRLSDQYHEEARAAIKILMQVASWLVSLTVMAVICYFIIRLAMFYIGTIQSAVNLR
ncbi:MAG: type II secretion system F family protein [Pirellulales bacterium]